MAGEQRRARDRVAQIGLGTEGAEPEFARCWEPTTEVSGRDFEESIRIARLVGAVAKQCYFNARSAVLKLDDYAEASYIEGFAAVDEGMAIEHGWVVRDGLVIDPTLPDGVRAYYPLASQRLKSDRESLESVDRSFDVHHAWGDSPISSVSSLQSSPSTGWNISSGSGWSW